ncbi:MAG: hypothetical protein Q7V88_05405 [Actinomycetota bacterium]|nr:hypothetical protein [Actinomycetota bacterium]
MKTRITTMLSLAGVLVAGSAAAMVNTEVLQGAGSKGTVTFVTAPSVVNDTPTTAATVPSPGTTLPPGTAVPPAVAPASTQAAYQIGESGLVTLDTAGDVLTIVGATPSPGWVLLSAENDDPYNIEVKFQAGATIIEFRANFLFGVVGTSVESSVADDDGSSTSTPGGGTSGGSTPAAGTIDDDDDHDGDDDHDDDGDDDDDVDHDHDDDDHDHDDD